MLSTYAFGDSAYPYQALGPVSVLWKPYILEDDKPDPPAPGEVKRGGAANARRRIANAENKARKAVETSKTTQALGRGKAKADAPARLPEASETSVRVCWLRAHPASFDMLFDAIRQAASRVLEARKAEGKEKEQVQIADLREKVLAFELMGPKSTQVLRGALDPVRTEERAEFRQVRARIAKSRSQLY
jgi:ribonuclease P/MRP protein subunit POP1